MRAKKEDLPVTLQAGAVTIREVEWGDMKVTHPSLPVGFDPSPLYRGLPDDRCPCPHWGYVVKGRIRVKYADRDEVYGAGDVYYMEPGHTAVVEEDYESVEFSPKYEMEKTLEVVARNMAAVE